MKKLTYILSLAMLAFSCQREDIIDGTAVSFYPTVVATGTEQDENTYTLNLATSQFIEGSAEVIVEVELTSEGVLTTSPPMDENKIVVPISNSRTGQISVTIENDATPDDYTATFRIVSASSGIQPSSTNKYTLFVQDTDFVPILSEDFSDCPSLEGFEAISVLGSTEWSCTDFGNFDDSGANTQGFRINAYGDSGDNEDWLISEQVNLTSYTTVSASFYSDLAFGGGPELDFRVSTDYDGNGDPSTATWTTLDAVYDTDTGYDNWTFSGNINLNSYITDATTIALVYLSSEADGASQWTIDDFSLNYFDKDVSNGGPSEIINVPFETDFEGCSDFSVPSGFDEVFVESTKTDTGWGCRTTVGVDGGTAVRVVGSGGAQMGDVDAWLITDSRLDFRGLPGAQLTFDIKSPFNGDGQLRVYHTDFYLGGDPTNFEWTEITAVTGQLPDKGDDVYTQVSVSVPEVSNTRSFFAFRLDGASATNSVSYDIDNLVIEAMETLKFSLPFTDDFETCEDEGEFNIPSNWIEENVPGFNVDRGWGCRDNGVNNSWAPRASAYVGGSASGEDDSWMISAGKFDLTGVTSAELSFYSKTQYAGPGKVTVYWSATYAGLGDPTQATWNELTEVTTQMESITTSFSEITGDLSGAAGQEVYLAFRYTEGTASSSIAIDIDDLSITGN